MMKMGMSKMKLEKASVLYYKDGISLSGNMGMSKMKLEKASVLYYKDGIRGMHTLLLSSFHPSRGFTTGGRTSKNRDKPKSVSLICPSLSRSTFSGCQIVKLSN